MNNPAKVPISEQAQHAREHYEEISMAAGHWSSIIPQAINAWERERLANNRVHWTAYGRDVWVFCIGFVFGLLACLAIIGGQ